MQPNSLNTFPSSHNISTFVLVFHNLACHCLLFPNFGPRNFYLRKIQLSKGSNLILRSKWVLILCFFPSILAACLFIVCLFVSSSLVEFYLWEWCEFWVEGWVGVPLGWILICSHQAPGVLPYWDCIRLISQHGVPQTMWVMLENPNPCLYILKGKPPTISIPHLYL